MEQPGGCEGRGFLPLAATEGRGAGVAVSMESGAGAAADSARSMTAAAAMPRTAIRRERDADGMFQQMAEEGTGQLKLFQKRR
jgi:hypothetical protein